MPTTDIVKLHHVNNGRSYAVTIPKQVVEELGLQKGSRIRVRANSKGEIILKPFD